MENMDSRPYPVNAIRVCIDAYDEDISGRIYSKMCETPLAFRDCGEMILRADRLFDACGYPQSFQEKREFQKARASGRYARPQVRLADTEIRGQTGRVRTVDVLVRSRRRAGWQGSILKENGGAANFESELELLRYLGINRQTKHDRRELERREEGCEK